MLKRLFGIFAVVVLICGSLIAFPSSLHWMVLLWVVIGLFAGARAQPMWPWLAGCLLILAIKLPGFTVEFWGLAAVLLGVASFDWQSRRKFEPSINWRRFAICATLLLLASANYGLSRWTAANTSRQSKLDHRPIVCLGDSLTAYGYPEELAKIVTVPVHNFGRNGIKTDDGLKMVPEILAVDPQLVVIELGGHDYNADQKPRHKTKANLARLIEAFLDKNVAVILVEIPRGFITDPYRGLERELASKYDLQLIDDSVVRRFVFFSPIIPPGSWLDESRHYSADGLHPNKLGNRHFANVVSQALVRVYGKAILR